MPLDTTILTDAWAYIRANPLTLTQEQQELHLANAMKAFVESADVMYVTGTLNSPSGTVTGAGTSIASLQ
ncbi:MAG: hypothetical protein JSS96_17520 [Bacteroidetes bacterium]|nr:hypothetical protein [Bacteroidota bacterium]